jgi:hypothetical protein
MIRAATVAVVVVFALAATVIVKLLTNLLP